MYEKVKYERKGFQPRLFNVRSDTGKLLTEDEEIKERWRIYFEDALNGGKKDGMEMQDDQIIWYNNKEETEAKETRLISSEHEEIIRALQSLKNGKAPGEDTITVELLKKVGKECQLRICNLILKIWQTETTSEKWKNGIPSSTHTFHKRFKNVFP